MNEIMGKYTQYEWQHNNEWMYTIMNEFTR